MGRNVFLYHGSDKEIDDPKCDCGSRGHLSVFIVGDRVAG